VVSFSLDLSRSLSDSPSLSCLVLVSLLARSTDVYSNKGSKATLVVLSQQASLLITAINAFPVYSSKMCFKT
jgi:hypothetical protein